MARSPKFSSDQILDAARAAVAAHGPQASIAQVSELVGAPVGSIYHRFASREELFVSLWLRSIHRFQAGFLSATEHADAEEALIAAALHVPRYCRTAPEDALAMTLYRQSALVTSGPASLVKDVRVVNADVIEQLRRLCRQRYGRVTRHRLDLVATAVQQCPYGLVRPYVGGVVPRWLDDAVAASTPAILALGD